MDRRRCFVITLFEKPVFKIPLIPVGMMSVPVCSKGIWDALIFSRCGKGEMLRKTAKALCKDIPDNMPLSSLREFADRYIDCVNEYCKANCDFFSLPEKPDFEHDEEPLKLPVLTTGENLVKEHTGFDFDRINELDILDYRTLLADACKLRILRRADGKGREYLNECYDFMHKNSNLFD